MGTARAVGRGQDASPPPSMPMALRIAGEEWGQGRSLAYERIRMLRALPSLPQAACGAGAGAAGVAGDHHPLRQHAGGAAVGVGQGSSRYQLGQCCTMRRLSEAEWSDAPF